MAKPRLTYVGHSYHARTGSTLFLQDLLASSFEVTTIWDESWKPDAPPLAAAAINATRPDYVVFFQRLPRRAEYVRIQCPNITWLPMHDSLAYGSHWRGWRGSRMKALCFCARDRAYFSSLGFEALHVQYAPAPLTRVPAGAALAVFFWLRHEAIGWDELKRLLGPQRPARIVLRIAPDPGHTPRLPSDEDRRAYSIDVQHGWMDAERYRQLLSTCSVFMAPRPAEGIGQALLEARAMGLAAVAPDAPTMNEYLRHGDTGYLYDPGAPAPLDFSDLAGVRRRSVDDLALAHERWLASRAELLTFVCQPAQLPPLSWRLRARLARN